MCSSDLEDDDFDDEDADEEGPSQTERLATLVKLLASVDLTLPPTFLTFMGDVEMQLAVPSGTACEWDLSERLIESPFEDDAFLICFLRDQQDCRFWYLCIGRSSTCILYSPVPYDDPELDETPEALMKHTFWVAPHFEHFVYRFWMENVLWELLADGSSLTPEIGRAHV